MKITFLSLFLPCIGAFITPKSPFQFHKSTSLSAESGPPKYDKLDGILRNNEVLAPGSVMLHIDVADETKLYYKPGHVLALEIQDENDDWLIGPYTISRCTESSVDVLIRVVGKKSERLATCDKDTRIKFGGKFKVPILDGISKECKRIVLLSTGVGVGPMIGAIEQALEDGSYPPIELFASYRTSSDVVYKEHLDNLSANLSFNWNAIISSEQGRISTESNLKKVFNNLSAEDTHYHMIGNAQMVKEWQTALLKAGVPEENVTIEQYFNHKAEINQEVVDRIAKAVTESCAAVNA